MAGKPRPITPPLLVDIHATMEIKAGAYMDEEKWALVSKSARTAVDNMVLAIKNGANQPIRVHIDTIDVTIKSKK